MDKSFLQTFNLEKAQQGDCICVSIFGSGGKTSLLFQLAREAASAGKRVLVSTTTKMWIPDRNQYRRLDLSARYISDYCHEPSQGIIIVGKTSDTTGKMGSIKREILASYIPHFDLTLLETDGAAGKPLKGWRDDEPVVPPFTTHSIGVIDISQIGLRPGPKSVHRHSIFLKISGADPEKPLALENFARLITSPDGLMRHAVGKQLLFLNKAETEKEMINCKRLGKIVPGYTIFAGSIQYQHITQI